MTRPYAYDDTATALFRPAAGLEPDDFFAQWTDEDAACDALLAAELSRLVYASPAVVEAALPRVGLALVRWIGGVGRFGRRQEDAAEGFVAIDGNGRACVVFRGTEASKLEDVIADLMTAQVPWQGGGRVHRGFAYAYGRVRDELAQTLAALRPPRVIYTGHSLGAALATLAAAEHTAPARLVTFGSPRVGDLAFVATRLNAVDIVRVVGCCDIVTRLPPSEFSRDQLHTLFMELYVGDGIAAGTLARAAPVLAATLRRAFGDPRFAHAGRARYIDRHGVLHRIYAEEFVHADQTAARAAYAAHHHTGSAPVPPRLFRNWPAPDSLAAFLAMSLATLRNGTVPLRDLADHAPINYLGAIARAVRDASGIG